MKKFKFVLLAFLGILSIDSFAQSNHHVRTHTYQGTPRYASYADYGLHSRIDFLAEELYMSRRQARRMHDVLDYYDSEIDRVTRERWTSRRLKRAKLRNLLADRDYEIRGVLSRRQYSKYREIRRWESDRRNRFSCAAHGASCRANACYNGYYENRWNDGWSSYWNRNRRGSWERDNRQRDNDDRWDDRRDRDDDRDYRRDRDDRWDDRDDRRGSTNHRNDRSDYEEDWDRYPYGKSSEKKKPEAKADVKITDASPSVDDVNIDEEEDNGKTEEEEMDEYFADEFDYGEEDLDDYFKDENK